MKIGIIGNMNNSYFSFARYLRDSGMDCELLIYEDEPLHFDPSCDSATDDFSRYCRKLNWGDPARFLSQDMDEVRRDLRPFEFLIGNGPAPAFVNRIGRKLDVFVPYGYDLYSLPFFRLVHPLRIPAYWTLRGYQRRGISESSHILFDRTNPSFEKVFQKLKLDGRRIVSPAPMIYGPEYEKLPGEGAGASPALQALRQVRSQTDLIFVQHTRQVWKRNRDFWSLKGNDLLIRGYARFLQENKLVSSRLVLFEYGSDVRESKDLVKSLGISDSVIWMPKMARKELMEVLRLSDLVVGELFHSWCTYGVMMEALCLGKPFMHKRNDAELKGDYPELYPMLYADSEASVAAGLSRVAADRQWAAGVGEGGRQWFQKYCVNRPVGIVADLVKQYRHA